MRDRIEDSNLVMRVALVAALVLLLMLLSWGIAVSNALAAVASGGGLAMVIVIGSSALLVPDYSRSQATERTLRVASLMLEHIHQGLDPSTADAICQLLLPETEAIGIAITNTEQVLAYAGDGPVAFPPGSPNTVPTREVLKSKRMETFVSMDSSDQRYRRLILGQDQKGSSFGIIVPLLVRDNAVGTIKLYYRRGTQIDRTQLAIARGLGELLSTQLSSYELDRQAQLAARAEVKALQAQINPHFLFNSLNTMASLTRTNPAKARELLREFAVFYRRTLESTESLIPLKSELEQTRRYLKIERARFGEDRIIETERLAPGLDELMVPAFLVQPIVENAVRHAMRDEGPLHIDVRVGHHGNDVLISVTDDGLGMDEAVANRLLEQAKTITGSEKGAGIALRNVTERLKHLFGPDSGIEIMSKEGEGTCVTLRLAGAMAKLGDNREDDGE